MTSLHDIQMAFVVFAMRPTEWDMAFDCITYGLIAVGATMAFLRLVWRDYRGEKKICKCC